MLTKIDSIRIEATKELDQKNRSKLGQFLTPSNVASFISSFFGESKYPHIELLDAGAGVGSLTASYLERQLEGAEKVNSIHITTYEIDQLLAQYLKANLSSYNSVSNQSKLTLSFDFIVDDFIKNATSIIKSKTESRFTHAILNPPYKKINSNSVHRHLLSSVGIETVNLYSGFVALSLLLLKEGGELVAIIPRSFCNGNYYKPFRELLIKESSINRIHLFNARNIAFKEDNVLQENVIIYLTKGKNQGAVTISHSTDVNLSDLNEKSYDFEEIVKPSDSEFFIHIPQLEKNILGDSTVAVSNLTDLDLKISTGPVVDFRVKDHIFMNPQPSSVPLLYPSHFNGKDIGWPKEGKKPNAIALNDSTKKMLYPNGFYTVVKRFSSKEEKQRIVARVINPNKLDSSFIGIENHLNVFHFNKQGIEENLAYGLAAYLNSTYVDIHFRSFNGHTQVNATDLKQMKYPKREILIELGRWAKTLDTLDPYTIDKKVIELI